MAGMAAHRELTMRHEGGRLDPRGSPNSSQLDTYLPHRRPFGGEAWQAARHADGIESSALRCAVTDFAESARVETLAHLCWGGEGDHRVARDRLGPWLRR